MREFDAETLLASDDWADVLLALLANGDLEKAIARVRETGRDDL